MADFDSSLPIRTETAGDVAVKIVDNTVPSQGLAVAADGSIAITDNGASLTVDATNLDIRDLAFATDTVDVSGSEVSLDATTLAALESVTVQNAAGASAVNIQDGGNSITVDGTVELGATTLAALETIELGASTLAALETIELGATTLAALESITVSATDLDIRNLAHAQDNVAIAQGGNTLIVNADGSINVALASDAAGTEIANYTTSASVGSGSSVNHDYTVTAAKTLLIKEVLASASGKIKVQVLVNAVVKAVAFNSTANPNIRLPLSNILKGAATQVVRITVTNLDNQSQDVYSTLLGIEIP